jgi:hypothetical protein
MEKAIIKKYVNYDDETLEKMKRYYKIDDHDHDELLRFIKTHGLKKYDLDVNNSR